jgi:hypothetical protein
MVRDDLADVRAACLDFARAAGVDPERVLEAWAERAAIREFDGGQARADAERAALDDLRAHAELLAAQRRGPRSAGPHRTTAVRRTGG